MPYGAVGPKGISGVIETSGSLPLGFAP